MGLVRKLLTAAKLASTADWQRYHAASRAFAAEGDLPRAVMWGRVAAEENPASADVWNDLGFALCGLGQSKWDESIHLQEVPANEPIRTEPHGHELAPLGHDLADQALARAQAVISCQEEAVAAWEEAMDALARALEIRPDFAQAHNNCGIALLKCNRVHEARDAFVRALQIYPGYANAKANLAFAERLVQRDT